MEVLFVLIGFSLLVAIFFLGSFIWAVKTGQYEDRYTPSVRMLFDDTQPKTSQSNLPNARRNDYAK
ncbi:MAG TPA: cbb3-type cytochrome oxidase assembly protein CcoS [Blastocatellia bacterium]|nr:cbb3-type cytochrome oxidase assembly protein CcoS [Blastocatellia bacterium]